MAKTGKRQREVGGGGGGGGKKRGDCSGQGAVGVGDEAGPELPGPRLGDGRKWDLHRAVAPKEQAKKPELGKLDELASRWRFAGKLLRKISKIVDLETWDTIKKYSEGLEGFNLSEFNNTDSWDYDLEDVKSYVHTAAKQLEALETDNARLRKRCGDLLEQALEGSEHGDVSFRFEDGRSPLTGHRAVLCAASEEYAGMFRSGMVEGQEGIIGVPPGVSEAGYRGLLEWAYIGRAGEECARANGRELWVLGEMYEVAGMREWLLEEAIDSSNVLGAYEFGTLGEGVDREGIVARCLCVVEEGGWAFEEASLRGVGREAVEGLALARARQGVDGRRLGWRCVRDAVRVVEGWMRANGGVDVGWYRKLVRGLDYTGMPLDVFRDVVVGCEYADGEWASGVLERKRALGGDLYLREYKVGRRYDLGEEVGNAYRMALHGEGSSQRMAVFDLAREPSDSRVLIYNVESGERVATAGSGGNEAGLMRVCLGFAFSSTGELYVSDYHQSRIQVFDREGRYVRGFGEGGRGEGQFSGPDGLCFTADGDLIVADSANHRVQVLREDGTFVRAFGSRGRGEGEFFCPTGVCVLPDGSIAVLDWANCRVQVFDEEWVFVRSIGLGGKGPGQFLNPSSVAVGAGGEIIVADYDRKDVQVFSQEGELLQIIGKGGDSDVDLNRIQSFATDASGRLFVLDGNSVVMLC